MIILHIVKISAVLERVVCKAGVGIILIVHYTDSTLVYGWVILQQLGVWHGCSTSVSFS